jgi:hypothetical protein
MADRNNPLLGQGELLTGRVEIKTGGGPKHSPYTYEATRVRLQERLEAVRVGLNQLPEEACPDGVAVAVLTMHPRYISKSDYPAELLAAAGLRAVGTRARTVTPEKSGIKTAPKEAVTEELFVAGHRAAFGRLSERLKAMLANKDTVADHLTHIEDITPYVGSQKVKGLTAGDGNAVELLEVVLHTGAIPDSVRRFEEFARLLGAEVLVSREHIYGDLAFVPVRIKASDVERLASYSLVRVARGMPTLRPIDNPLARTNVPLNVTLPIEGPTDDSFRAVIFDGGLPAHTNLSTWVNYIEPAGLGPPNPAFQAHGLYVTGAFLFGALAAGDAAPRPFCAVDHVRVVDQSDDGSDLMYLNVLDRILTHLDDHGPYDFINISLGPRMAVDDDHPTPWTVALDTRLAGITSVCCVATGNDGELNENRVQPPSDGVNVCSVGASSSVGAAWARAPYSCIGPGRSPGLVKPDILGFGGSTGELFYALKNSTEVAGVSGTSVACPVVLRTASGVRSKLGPVLNALALRALLIHHADPGAHTKTDVGWGNVPLDVDRLISSEDHEVCVVYQGFLPVGEHLRADIPLPSGPLKGEVVLRATLLIAPAVDPARPSNYTRSGLEVSFRPHSKRFTTYRKTGKVSKHPKTIPFFSEKNMYSAAEFELRDDGQKWEPCRRHEHKFKPSQLDQPAFDIYYHHRNLDGVAPTPIPYAMVVGLKAVEMPDLYNRVVRTYSHALVQLREQVNISISAV